MILHHFECTIYKVTKTGAIPHRVSIDEITAEERAGKELLGKADGRDIGHGVYLGVRHCKGFLERVKWYYRSNETDALLKALQKSQQGTIRVEFYGEKRV